MRYKACGAFVVLEGLILNAELFPICRSITCDCLRRTM
jgi:aminopeptidase-like protein